MLLALFKRYFEEVKKNILCSKFFLFHSILHLQINNNIPIVYLNIFILKLNIFL